MCDVDNIHDPLSANFRPFVDKLVDRLVSYLEDERSADSGDANTAVCDFMNPDELTAALKPLQIEQMGASTDELLSNVRLILDKTVKTGHRNCINQLFHRADGISILAEWISSVINTSVYTYETAPVVTLMEKQLIEMYRGLLGWDNCEGFFAPGGSTSNLYGLTLARASRFPHVQAEGWKGDDKPVVYASAAAHYSTKKACGVLGMGYNCLNHVGTNAANAMCATKLKEAIEEDIAAGKHPMCVVATTGSTLTGAHDNIEDVLAVCEPYGIWVHVDGCLGGGLIHSPTHRHVLNGVERADSFAMNPHKMLGVVIQCSVFVTRRRDAMRNNFSTNAAYLFNADKQYDSSYDVGDSVFQCGRKVDCLKLWMVWKQRGDVGMANYVDRAVATHRTFNEIVLSRSPQFKLMLDSPSTVPATCFWWLPEELSHVTDMRDAAVFKALDPVIPRAKVKLMEQGTVILTNSCMPGLPNFWRFVAIGGTPWTESQIEHLLNDLAKACQEVYDKLTPAVAVNKV